MKAMHRHALRAAGLLVALAAGAAGTAEAQPRYRQNPDVNTPRILIPTFRSPDRNLGVQAADQVRDRVIQDVNVRQLFALYKSDIAKTLEASGYRADSALSPMELRELARLLRADLILDGRVTSIEGGVRIEPRLWLARDVSLVQPLPPIDARNAGDAAKVIVREMQEARKQLKDNQDCENGIRAGNHDAAIESARKAIAAYPRATIARLCLATALQAKDAPADEIIAMTDEVLAIDPRSRIALGLKYGALREKGDEEAATATLIAMLGADPGNQTLQEQVINALASSGAPERAVPLVDTLVANNPGDPSLVRTQWLVLLRANQFARAMDVGDTLARLDTAAVDSTWFVRQIAAAVSDSQPAKAAEYASRGVAKYPQSASLLALQSQTLRRAGQLEQALAAMKRAVAIDPQVENGYLFLVVTQAELGQTDSAMVTARQAIAAGVDRETIGNALLASVSPLLQAAQASKARADWQAAYELASAVDSLAPTQNSAFFAGLAAFQVGLDALQTGRTCADARLAESMWAASQIAMTRGARVDTATAGQVLGAIQQYSENITAAKAQRCR